MKNDAEKCISEKKFDPFAIQAIVGLGNPGFKYYKTRHSIGFRVLDVLAARYAVSWKELELFQHAILMLPAEGDTLRPVHLIKPLTFMNSSGKVMSFLSKKGIKTENILVVHDELEKPVGSVAVRWNGSARGHNGLRSIIGVIGDQFWRLRFGIGRPEDKSEVSNYVLSSFTPEELSELDELIERAVDLIDGGMSI
ncbi:aminoacyl-tRNA hydrolase [Candidatus Babeliales bacterium]|nr:aminoacyl-tRNA hydrolase [Candidatus Babeliales bacterium]